MVPSQLRKRRHEQHDQNVQSLLWDLFTCFFGTKNQIFSLPKNERLEPEDDDVLEKNSPFPPFHFQLPSSQFLAAFHRMVGDRK